jgi:hypothetical protein
MASTTVGTAQDVRVSRNRRDTRWTCPLLTQRKRCTRAMRYRQSSLPRAHRGSAVFPNLCASRWKVLPSTLRKRSLRARFPIGASGRTTVSRFSLRWIPRATGQGNKLAPSHELPSNEAHQAFREQRALTAIHPPNKAPHLILPRIRSRESHSAAFSHSQGQNEKPPYSGLCQLRPAADIRVVRLMPEKCQEPTLDRL